MQYQRIVRGTFQSRPNRFVAVVEIDGKEERVHVKNTGRCRELLVSGACVYLEKAKEDGPARKTAFDLIAVEKETERGRLLINMDSQAPNGAAAEGLRSGRLWIPGLTERRGETPDVVRREVTYGNSRFDLYAEHNGKRALIEVKGVTLEREGTALFPDAPTERGVKHVRELIHAKKEGYVAAVVFVVQMAEAMEFRPNEETHEDFARALREAKEEGVEILAYRCGVTPESLAIDRPIPVIL